MQIQSFSLHGKAFPRIPQRFAPFSLCSVGVRRRGALAKAGGNETNINRKTARKTAEKTADKRFKNINETDLIILL